MILDSEQLRTFLTIAETGSFTRAAEEVGRTQAAVSMQIKKLEDRIGRSLFDRSGRAVRLTPEGRTLLGYARKIIALNDQAVDAFSTEVYSGEVRLGLPDDYAERLLPMVLAAFHRSHPNVEIHIDCHSSNAVCNKIARGELDLGIVTHSDAGGTIVRREPLLWVGSDALAADMPDPVPLALGDETCAWRRAAFRALESVGRQGRVTFRSPSGSAICSAVAAGLVVSVLPQSAVRADLRVLTPVDGFPTLPMCDIALLRARHATEPVHDALARHITLRLNNLEAGSGEAAA